MMRVIRAQQYIGTGAGAGAIEESLCRCDCDRNSAVGGKWHEKAARKS